MFKKNKKIIFYPKIDELEHKKNILLGNDLKRSWFQKQKEAFSKLYKKWRQSDGSYRISSTHRCPAIKSIINRGCIIQAPKDYFIHSCGDVEAPTLNLTKNPHDSGISEIAFFDRNLVAGFERPFPEITPNVIFKISLPYYIDAPDDTVFISIPVPYVKSEPFTVLSGIVDPKISNLLQVLFWWHDHDNKNIDHSEYFCKNKSYYIAKHTPLMQLIPVPRNYTFNYEIISDQESINKQRDKYNFQIQEGNPQYSRIKKLVNFSKLKENTLKWEKTNLKSKCPFAFLHKK